MRNNTDNASCIIWYNNSASKRLQEIDVFYNLLKKSDGKKCISQCRVGELIKCCYDFIMCKEYYSILLLQHVIFTSYMFFVFSFKPGRPWSYFFKRQFEQVPNRQFFRIVIGRHSCYNLLLRNM